MLEKFNFWVGMAKTAMPYIFVILFVLVFGLTMFKVMQATVAKPGVRDNIKIIENAGNVMPEIAKEYLDSQTSDFEQHVAKSIKEKQQD